MYLLSVSLKTTDQIVQARQISFCNVVYDLPVEIQTHFRDSFLMICIDKTPCSLMHELTEVNITNLLRLAMKQEQNTEKS